MRDVVRPNAGDGWRAAAHARPAWVLRLELRFVVVTIDRLERELANEFATVDVAPLVAELQSLCSRRTALLERLGLGAAGEG